MFNNQRLIVYILIALGVLFVRENPMSGDEHQQTAQQVKLLFPQLKAQLPTIASITISDSDSRLVKA